MKKALFFVLLFAATTHVFAQGHRYCRGGYCRPRFVGPVYCGYAPRPYYAPVYVNCAPPQVIVAYPQPAPIVRNRPTAQPLPSYGESVVRTQAFTQLKESNGSVSIGNRAPHYADLNGSLPKGLEVLPTNLGIGYADYLASDPVANSLCRDRDNVILTAAGPIVIRFGTTNWYVQYPDESLDGAVHIATNARIFSLGR